MNFELPEDFNFQFSHLGNLFCLDQNKDGRFCLEDAENFARMMARNFKKYKQHEMQNQLQGFCSLQMWSQVCGDEAKEADFVAWLQRLLYENQSVKYFEANPEIPFLRAETIKCLYEMLNMRQTHNIEFQVFLSLLQKTAEEKELMTQEEEMDDFVPLPVITNFAEHFIRGFGKLMSELGFSQRH